MIKNVQFILFFLIKRKKKLQFEFFFTSLKRKSFMDIVPITRSTF